MIELLKRNNSFLDSRKIRVSVLAIIKRDGKIFFALVLIFNLLQF